MALQILTKVNIRRHLGYPLAGLTTSSPAGGTLSSANNAYRFFGSYGQLEFRMNQLAPSEEAVLTGSPYGAVGFNNANTPIVAGTVITVTLNSPQFSTNPVILTYTVQPTDDLLIICGQLANQAALNTDFTAAGFYAINDYGTGPWSQQIVPFPICSFIAPSNSSSFSINVSGSGNTVPQVVANGQLLPPAIYLETTIPAKEIFGYLPILDTLESFYAGTVQNLSTTKAREWTRNSRELTEKKMLYNQWRQRLAQFMGISLDLRNNADLRGRSSNRLVM
jgi:hypothetical protein